MFHNIEELTTKTSAPENSGQHVFWRGIHVDHYDFPPTPEGQRREREAADRLAGACRRIEARGDCVSCMTLSIESMWDGVNASDAIRDVAMAIGG